MKIYYFVHLTGQDPGNTGIQRVVRNLGTALQYTPTVVLVPVRWSGDLQAVVHVEPSFKNCMGLYKGPRFAASSQEGRPIHEDIDFAETTRWLLIPEVPHLANHSADYPSVPIFRIFGYLRGHKIKSAVVFYDLIPLTSGLNSENESEKLHFTIYGQALAHADLIMPVSTLSANQLCAWLIGAGVRRETMPTVLPILLPEELVGTPKGACLDVAPSRDPLQFLTLGTLCTRKNQVRLMEAFNLLVQDNPGLNLRLNVLGHVHPEVSDAVARAVRRSGGKIRMLGFVSDERFVELAGEARATAFVSLAEGYGLPVAESLWLGRPCLTSRREPMVEVAEGGGCVFADPTDVSAIRDELAALVHDEALHAALMAQIRSRHLRTWSTYAGEIFAAIRAMAKTGKLWTAFEPGETDPSFARRTITVTTPEMLEHPAYRTSRHSLRRDRLLVFDKALNGSVGESTLFHGPYLTMSPGSYQLRIEGVLTGRLTIRFMAEGGMDVIGETAVEDFGKEISFELTRPVKNFEILFKRERKTEHVELRSLLLRRTSP